MDEIIQLTDVYLFIEKINSLCQQKWEYNRHYGYPPPRFYINIGPRADAIICMELTKDPMRMGNITLNQARVESIFGVMIERHNKVIPPNFIVLVDAVDRKPLQWFDFTNLIKGGQNGKEKNEKGIEKTYSKESSN